MWLTCERKPYKGNYLPHKGLHIKTGKLELLKHPIRPHEPYFTNIKAFWNLELLIESTYPSKGITIYPWI